MTKINNLFFFYVLSCIGLGVGDVYWDKHYAHYIFMGVSVLIGFLIFFSKYFYTKESYEFFRKQVFFNSLISILCFFLYTNSNVYKVIDLGFYNAFLGALIFWIFTLKYRSGGNSTRGNNTIGTGNGTTLA